MSDEQKAKLPISYNMNEDAARYYVANRTNPYMAELAKAVNESNVQQYTSRGRDYSPSPVVLKDNGASYHFPNVLKLDGKFVRISIDKVETGLKKERQSAVRGGRSQRWFGGYTDYVPSKQYNSFSTFDKDKMQALITKIRNLK